MKVLLSGVHSGPNPSPGVGTARSIRAAFPDAELIGVDYSARSSGLHDPVFDDVWVARPWDELDLDLHAEQISGRLGTDGVWLSGLDLETIWLASTQATRPGLLVPNSRAVKRTAKPGILAGKPLGLQVPPYVSTIESDWELHRFCRRYGWRVWLKGPYHEAMRVHSWPQLQAHRAELEKRWSTGDLFLQADVTGIEESVCYTACSGDVLAAVRMTKREVTGEGKTWAGRIDSVPEKTMKALASTIGDLGWTGGGEIECVRDADGALWVIDWNPRFPAWVHGATLAGRNLPAELLAAATGEPGLRARRISREFTRVVHEVPVRVDLPLPALAEPAGVGFHFVGKHPSSTTELARRMHGARRARRSVETPVPAAVLADVREAPLDDLVTPARILLPQTAREQFQRAKSEAARVGNIVGVNLSVAYSIKTNPDPELMTLARDIGMLAEGINAAEIRTALALGWEPGSVILNGPAKSWTGGRADDVLGPLPPLKVTFSDSLEELEERVTEEHGPIGFRLRPPALRSRFGIAVDDPGRYSRLVRLLRSAPKGREIAIHFHMASNVIGVLEWWTLFESVLETASEISRAAERPVTLLDFGGGWFPDDWFSEFVPGLEKHLGRAVTAFPALREVVVEPGKALTQPVHALVVRVLEIRGGRGSGPGGRELVVDGAISDLPEAHSYPHRVLFGDGDGGWRAASRGSDRLLGRICMEHDVLARDVKLPPDVREGDHLVFADAGAYDRSMSYEFGRGH